VSGISEAAYGVQPVEQEGRNHGAVCSHRRIPGDLPTVALHERTRFAAMGISEFILCYS
jgi:hypothetical protein